MIGFISKAIQAITAKKVIIWLLAISSATVIYTAYENRVELFGSVYDAPVPGQGSLANVPVFSLSEGSKSTVKDFVLDNPDVISFMVFSADLRLNSRTLVHFYTEPLKSSDPEEVIMDNIRVLSALRQATRLPLFIKKPEINKQIVKLLNGDFGCTTYSGSPFAIAAPTLNKGAVAICSASLPPYYGFFAGFVTIVLKIDPTVEIQTQLKSQLNVIASEIYFKDVAPFNKKRFIGY